MSDVKVRLTNQTYGKIMWDLRRRHEFARERVGFAAARLGNRGHTPTLVLVTRYIPIPDERYVDDPGVGARIDAEAIRFGMQHVLTSGEGLFHVHLHDWPGVPELGRTDLREIPPMVTSFRNVGLDSPHGILLFSQDKATCTTWLPGLNQPVEAQVIAIGTPLLRIDK